MPRLFLSVKYWVLILGPLLPGPSVLMGLDICHVFSPYPQLQMTSIVSHCSLYFVSFMVEFKFPVQKVIYWIDYTKGGYKDTCLTCYFPKHAGLFKDENNFWLFTWFGQINFYSVYYLKVALGPISFVISYIYIYIWNYSWGPPVSVNVIWGWEGRWTLGWETSCARFWRRVSAICPGCLDNPGYDSELEVLPSDDGPGMEEQMDMRMGDRLGLEFRGRHQWVVLGVWRIQVQTRTHNKCD